MPAINLIKDPRLERQHLIERIVRTRMAEHRVMSVKDLAGRIRANPETLAKRLCGATKWDLETLAKLAHTLQFSAEDAARILGVKK